MNTRTALGTCLVLTAILAGAAFLDRAQRLVPASSAEAAARQLDEELTAAGQRVTGAALGRAIGRSERYGRLLLAGFRAQDEGSDRHNGDGAARHEQADPKHR